MENEKSQKSLRIINDNNKFNNNIIPNEGLCTICMTTIKNPCSGLCGCQYCWDCMECYLNDDEKCCPGKSSECQSQLLSIEGNVLIDQDKDREVSRVIVKCPDQCIKFTDELKRIEDILQENNCKESKCPYYNIGCRELKTDEIDQHLNIDNYSHTKLLMQWICNLRNDLRSIRSEVFKTKKENKELKKEMKNIKKDLDIKQTIISELQQKDHKQSQQIEYLMDQLQDTQYNFEAESLLVENEPEYPDDEIDDLTTYDTMSTMTINDNHQYDYTNQFDMLNDKMENLNDKIMKLEINQDKLNYGEFLWTIEQFSDKIKEARKMINREMYSDPFYSHKNGYKMCLRVDPSGINLGKGSHLALYFCIVKGPFDDILQWPMKHSVTFSLINQHNGFIHTSRTVKFEDVPDNFAWNKPTTDRKIGFGFHKFITMDELLNNRSLCENDQIFIRCSVHNYS